MGGCAGTDPEREGETLQSSQQPNFRVGLLFLELSSLSARSVGRLQGLLRLCNPLQHLGDLPELAQHLDNRRTVRTQTYARGDQLYVSCHTYSCIGLLYLH